MEWNVWRVWYDSIVLIVRKRVVQEITSTGDGDEETDDESNPITPETTTSATPKTQKSLQRLLSQQSNEIEELREQLTKARHLNLSQGTITAATVISYLLQPSNYLHIFVRCSYHLQRNKLMHGKNALKACRIN